MFVVFDNVASRLLLVGSVLILAACGHGTDEEPQGTPAPPVAMPVPAPGSDPADVLVYGATPGGISAALEAAKLKKRVVILEPTKHVGGMTTSGIGVTDAYPQDRLWAMGGFAHRFVDAVNTRYGKTWTMGGIFHEPHVAESILLQMLADAPSVSVEYGAELASVQTNNHEIKVVQTSNGHSYAAKMFIDASYEGDLLEKAGVDHTLGREAKSQYGEPLAGVGPISIKDGARVDPYVVPGQPNSGLLPHVAPNNLGAPGTADSAVQAYGYRLCLTADKGNQIPVVKPANYDPKEFELLGRVALAHPEIVKTFNYIANVPIPNNKFDVNSLGLLSTDEIEGSAEYANANANGRRQIEAEHKRYTLALLTFLATDPRIPPNVRDDVRSWGFCKDEFQDNGGFPWRLYVRESRRMIGSYVMTQHDLYTETRIPDPIGLGAFPIDQHTVNRIAVDGQVGTEGAIWQPLPRPYPISYRSIVPKYSEIRNLLVPVALSASHVAYSSIRVEPTFMITGQAAGAAAALAIDSRSSVQNIDYAKLSATLVSEGAVLANR
ncbi:FAD-dependent oxidoreductase [Burkholderia cepacia]|uniref:FAD-dependent oxidoreductase n=1 Tax=Burkholderia cepacia TaxID=292 RepID=UPI000F59084C|nr:FAD-dependent oxidoreductase [Burkholderia cepacia]MBJ9753133.1 FAD-dependent oxidoreductase [Burkholderia cepacia]MDN7910362.1 FAD-dependent oxidoreductase [Burkholderia cepacia]RQT43925.1 FAD-dependent oxidoreductase [Burkholderia cepacia]RQZ87152.1 FAD-dependent oxidoreductase [Burkholderia cepacia]HDR9499037.1 FAD-dependent oxidoreductase [Burkholderia cepacia]